MLVGCLSIIIILLLMSFVFVRAKKRSYSLVCLMLSILPFMHILVEIFGNSVSNFLNKPFNAILILVDVVSVIISNALIIIIAKKYPQHKQVKLSIFVSLVYSILLASALIINTIN